MKSYLCNKRKRLSAVHIQCCLLLQYIFTIYSVTELYISQFHYRARKDLDVSQMVYHHSKISAVIETISAMTNPFDADLKDLINIASTEVAEPCVMTNMLAAKEIGERKFKEFMEEKVRN